MFEAFEKASGIQVKFIRLSSGEALARVIAEKGNPQVDVLFGGPVETFTAGAGQGIFAPTRRRARRSCRSGSRVRRAAPGRRSPTIRWCS